MNIKTIEKARELGFETHSYSNGDWVYRDTDRYWYLFRNSEELSPEIKKTYVNSYNNGDWEYEDLDGYYHLFRDGEELLPEINKTYVKSYDNGDWVYQDTNGEWHTIEGDNNEY